MNSIEINGEIYVKQSEIRALPETSDNVHMVRTYSAGVFYGEIEKREGNEVTLKYARRVYYWDGAATLSQLAQKGTSKPENCKFPMVVTEVLLLDVIEIIPVTKEALTILNSVPVWEK